MDDKAVTMSEGKIASRSGVALWRQVADQLRGAIDRGDYPPGSKLPAEFEIGRQAGVNRHTVRAAIAHLAAEGLVATRHGLGTIVTRTGRLSYPIRLRTRLSAGLSDQVAAIESRLLDATIRPAERHVAAQLGLESAAPVLELETLSTAEGRPISLATHWLDAGRFHGFAERFAEIRSMTAAFRHYGIEDYIRRETRVLAEGAGEAELQNLVLPKGSIVLVATGTNATVDGRVFHLTRTRFPADRIELRIEH
jgi:GntR family phosphonate transport system transcriptional regulator